jgi:hypothetical protein
MEERTSKILLLIESLVFLMPVSLLTLFYALFLIPMYRSGLASEPWGAQVAPVFTVLGLALQLCGWRVIVAFLVDGRGGIRAISKGYIHAITAGAALVALSGLVVLLMVLELELPGPVVLLSVNYVAIPALIPFIHVMVERRASQRAHVDEPI